MLKLCAIVKDSGPILKKVLQSFKSECDSFLILDTGSTDGTQENIRKVLKNCKYELYEEPFEGFSKSRNRCLDLCDKSEYKADYYIMIDDSYELKQGKVGDLRKEIKNKKSDTVSIQIRSNENLYYSTRIIKSNSNKRYVGEIHEWIPSEEKEVIERCYLEDNSCEEHFNRTKKRLYNDLIILKKEKTARNLYYLGITYKHLYYMENNQEYKKEYIKNFIERLMIKEGKEERFLVMILLGHQNFYDNQIIKALEWYTKAAKEFEERCGEAYFYKYCITGEKEMIKKAYENRNVKAYSLPINYGIYLKEIPRYYNQEMKI